jgi:hypothetical protein
MFKRRMLFAGSGCTTRLAAIYAAFLSLGALSVTGFVVAFWPTDPPPAQRAHPSPDAEAAQAGGSSGGSVRKPPEARVPRNPSTWM